MHVEKGGDVVLTCCGVGCGIEGYSRHDQQAVRWCSWLSRSPHTRKVLSSSLSRISRFFLLLAPSDFDGMGAFGLFFCRGLYFFCKCEVRCHILGGSEMINAVNRSVSHLTSTFCRSPMACFWQSWRRLASLPSTRRRTYMWRMVPICNSTLSQNFWCNCCWLECSAKSVTWKRP